MKSNYLSLIHIGIATSSFIFLHDSGADTVTNRPSADTTLFEAFPSNNLGATDLTSGSTAASLRSRALIKFDLLGALPPHATVNSVTPILMATRQPLSGMSSNYRLFRLLQPWAEGDKTGVHGAPAELGEATWNDRFAFETGGNWSAPGAGPPKDFSSALSASAFIDGEGRLTFTSTSNLLADVQFWLNNPTNNYGWILVSDAEDVPQTVTHFGSREDPTNAPVLVIGFTLPSTAQPPRISRFGIATNSFALVFNAQAQEAYTIQYLASLATTNWQTLTNIAAPAIATNVVVSDPISSTQRFYRLHVDPRPNMVFIPPGSFTMGSPSNEVDRFGNEGPQTTVTISRGFWIGRYAVTQKEYEGVMGSNPSHFTGDSNRPVEQVSWFDATNYCHQLTQQERAAGTIPTDCLYRLPTEAEWEYACRAGASTRFSYGDDLGYTNLTNYAWYSDNSGFTTHPVGQKLPNPWGLYDVHGNILEWCHDGWGGYTGGSAIDPQGPAAGSLRVIRGGSWLRIAAHCRSAFRHSFSPDVRNILIGFRVVLAPSQP